MIIRVGHQTEEFSETSPSHWDLNIKVQVSWILDHLQTSFEHLHDNTQA